MTSHNEPNKKGAIHMRRQVVVSVVLAVLIVGCGPQNKDTSTIKRVLEEKVVKFVDAFNKQDVDGLTADYWNSPDLAVYYPDGNYIGYDAVRKSWENFFQNVTVKRFAVNELHTEVDADGEVAYQWGLYNLEMQPKAGPEISAPGRFTQVWRNMNGKWLIVLDHASAPLPPPPAPGSESTDAMKMK